VITTVNTALTFVPAIAALTVAVPGLLGIVHEVNRAMPLASVMVLTAELAVAPSALMVPAEARNATLTPDIALPVPPITMTAGSWALGSEAPTAALTVVGTLGAAAIVAGSTAAGSLQVLRAAATRITTATRVLVRRIRLADEGGRERLREERFGRGRCLR
jgi:hypothetical protein